jgi:hypothetical protein
LATPAYPASPRSSVSGEHGDLPDRYAAQFHQITHRGVGFLCIARTEVEDIAIGRIAAHDIAAGVGTEEQHPPFEQVRDRGGRGRRADASDDAEDLVLLVKLPDRFAGPRRLVAVVGGDDPEHSPSHTSGVVNPVESRLDAEFHLAAAFLYRTGKGRRDSKPDFAVGDAANRSCGRGYCGWRSREHRCGGRGRDRRRTGCWTRRVEGLFEICEPAVRLLAVHPARRDSGAAVRDAAIEQLREIGPLSLVGRGLPDHGRELLHDRLNARPRDLGAGQRRANDGSDPSRKVAYEVGFVARGCFSSGCKRGTN